MPGKKKAPGQHYDKNRGGGAEIKAGRGKIMQKVLVN